MYFNMRKSIKRFISCVAVTALTLCIFAGCGTTEIKPKVEGMDTGASSDKISGESGLIDDGVLKVAMEIGYPPFEYYDDDGSTPTGIDVDLGKAIADQMGIEAEFLDTGWDGIFAGLTKGDYDCIISGVTITPDRLAEFSFSDSYIKNYICVVTNTDADKKPASLEELEGLKVAYQEETTADIFITDYAKAHDIKFDANEYAKVINCFDDMKLGRVDAVVCDSSVAQKYISEGAFEITWKQDSDPEEFGICVKKDNIMLVDRLNKALATLQANGTIDDILKKYL